MPEEDFFGDAQPVDYEWDLLDFSADRLLLQLNLTNPQEVSIDGRVDVLKVTFWDTSYFKSKDGVSCRCGSSLT